MYETSSRGSFLLCWCVLFITTTFCSQLISAQLDCPYTVGTAPFRPGVHTELYRGQQAFSINLLQAIQEATPNENIFFSPYSTYHVLLLAYFGASGETEKELTKALHLEWATAGKTDVHRGYRVEKQKRELRSKKMPLEFSSADKIYFDKSIKLSDCLGSSFGDELESLDFRTQSEPARLEVNEWIANVTHKEISNMLKAGDVTADTKVLLANAAYFKGQWSSMFDVEETKKEIFFTSATEHTFVDMMHATGTYNFYIDEMLGAYVLQLPYLTSNKEATNEENDTEEKSEISMFIILPPTANQGLETVLTRLTADSLERALNESSMREIDVSLPKFEFEQNLELLPILRKVGINKLFAPGAELRHFSTDEDIVFGDAKHVAKIKVDEHGSTAAAATVLFSFRSARPAEPTKFECNHPFLFAIYDQTAKAVLFTGIYRKP